MASISKIAVEGTTYDVHDSRIANVLPVANGGTGVTTAQAERNRLGLGNTTGAVPIANGGTGATTAAAALTNLGIASGIKTQGTSGEWHYRVYNNGYADCWIEVTYGTTIAESWGQFNLGTELSYRSYPVNFKGGFVDCVLGSVRADDLSLITVMTASSVNNQSPKLQPGRPSGQAITGIYTVVASLYAIGQLA